jgi:hypothetical protein
MVGGLWFAVVGWQVHAVTMATCMWSVNHRWPPTVRRKPVRDDRFGKLYIGAAESAMHWAVLNVQLVVNCADRELWYSAAPW